MSNPSTPDPLQQLQADVRAIVTEVERLTGHKSTWSGHVVIGTELNTRGLPRYLGGKAWNCDIVLHQSRLLSPSRYSTLIHEAFHSFSIGLNQVDYDAYDGLEEGIVEQCTRLFRAAILAGAGLPLPMDTRTSYNSEIALLELLRLRAQQTDTTFYLLLLSTPLQDREARILQWIHNAEPTKTPQQIALETSAIRAGLKP